MPKTHIQQKSNHGFHLTNLFRLQCQKHNKAANLMIKEIENDVKDYTFASNQEKKISTTSPPHQ